MTLDPVTTSIIEAVVRSAGQIATDVVKERLARTRQAAEAKRGEPLEVNDRIAVKALSEAAFNDDALMADYLGGVLAASESDSDAAAAVVALIGRLSALQLRLHYVIYREVRRLWNKPTLNLYQWQQADSAGVRIPRSDLFAALGAKDQAEVISAVYALSREELVRDQWAFDPETEDDPQTWNLRVRPTALGAEFFLWGHGARPVVANRLLDPRTELVLLTDVPSTPNSSLLTPPATSDAR